MTTEEGSSGPLFYILMPLPLGRFFSPVLDLDVSSTIVSALLLGYSLAENTYNLVTPLDYLLDTNTGPFGIALLRNHLWRR